MPVLSIKLSSQLDEQVQGRAKAEQLSKSELVRRALLAYLRQEHAAAQPVSALVAVNDLVGSCVGAPSDLASNPSYLKDFGRV